MTTVQDVIKELYQSFRELNKEFFNSELVEPAITVQSGGKRKSMGWCTTKEIWTDKNGENRKYEINISAEYIDLSFTETMDTLLHEMVHLYNLQKGIQDCSRNGTYHNKKFKNECLQRGFYFENDKPDKRYGWFNPRLKEETIEQIKTLDIDENVFSIARRTYGYKNPNEDNETEGEENSDDKKKTSYKWTCSSCELIIRSSKPDIFIICGNCDEELTCENS